MRKNPRTPEELAEDLLGRRYDDLDPEEQNVLRRIASGTLIGQDADELAMARATFGDRLADRVAAVGGSWGFIIAFGLVLLGWMLVNSRVLEDLGLHPFDAYPYIFLNHTLTESINLRYGPPFFLPFGISVHCPHLPAIPVRDCQTGSPVFTTSSSLHLPSHKPSASPRSPNP